MNALSPLTNDELAFVMDALNTLSSALEMLLERGVLNEDVDPLELADALEKEILRRAIEDAEYHVQQAVLRGELVAVIRPDGQIGYAPA